MQKLQGMAGRALGGRAGEVLSRTNVRVSAKVLPGFCPSG